MGSPTKPSGSSRPLSIGRLTCSRRTPKELYQSVLESPLRLVNDYLMGGSTPKAFDEYARYFDFVHAVSERTGVHPRNLYLRGSCQIGYSIAPRSDKVWTTMSDDSDLDHCSARVSDPAGVPDRRSPDSHVQHWRRVSPPVEPIARAASFPKPIPNDGDLPQALVRGRETRAQQGVGRSAACSRRHVSQSIVSRASVGVGNECSRS